MILPSLRRRVLFVAASALVLAGCGGLFPKTPPRQLYRVAPEFAFRTALPHVAAQLIVDVPVAPAGLDTARIALSRLPLSLDYFADAQWTDRAPLLVQSALVDAFEKSHALAGVGREGFSLHADLVLETELDHFEAVYDSPDGAPRVRVTLDLQLVRMPQRAIAAQTSLTREARAAGTTIPQIVPAFGAALGAAAEAAVVWTVDQSRLVGAAPIGMLDTVRSRRLRQGVKGGTGGARGAGRGGAARVP